ncbi:MAG: carboxy terminal-processing peptidase [Gammaproteobacteria bacterium]|nr:carboxy terminal-processing peptidase [Gammaproteobacteria bacterium]
MYIPRQLSLALVLVAVLVSAPCFGTSAQIVPLDQHERATRLITHFLDKYHYKDFSIDDLLSEQIMDAYVGALDPNRSYFHQKDIEGFEVFRFGMDEALNHRKLDAPFAMFHLYRNRVNERVTYALDLIGQEFDFDVHEEFLVDRSDSDWAQDVEGLNEIWRKRVKNDVLSLRLAGETPDEIRETLGKRYRSITRRSQLDAEDVYQLFINAFMSTLEPHTKYLSPRTSENFAIRMSLSLQGIGALLRAEGDYTLVESIIPGGPADLSNLLHASDRIVGIAQQDETEFRDVVGWRLEEVVELIRGAKDTVVRLQILPGADGPSAKVKEIQITRDEITLEEQAAKSEIIDIRDEARHIKVGVIDVPAFYIDFAAYQRGESDYRSTTRDVEQLISELKQDNVDALVLDLRGNGGGSLTEATQFAGLFIDEGPVVQVQDSRGNVRVHRDRDPKISYQGPLVVLVDRFSASASEIVASAIQDYQYGMVVGETTFGKGTVQQLINLNSFDSGAKAKLGQLKTTIAQYFRINGNSTQHKGVVPDIDFQTIYADEEHGERALKNALPWSSISALRHPYGMIDRQVVGTAADLHKSRITNDEKYRLLMEMIQLDYEVRNRDTISLLESTRKKEHEQAEAVRANRDELLKTGQPPSVEGEEEEFVDVLLEETAHIAADLVKLMEAQHSSAFGDRNFQ